MEADKVDYILKYFSSHMTDKEAAAWRHWIYNEKIVRSKSSPEHKVARIKILTEKKWLSNDPEVISLLEEGIDTFRINTAKRIFKDHPEGLDFNCCPKCGKLARTPFAKQCRYCQHDWH